MATQKLCAFRLPVEQIAGLERIKAAVGIPLSTQVRKAIDAWLTSQAGAGRRAKKTRRRK